MAATVHLHLLSSMSLHKFTQYGQTNVSYDNFYQLVMWLW